VNVDIHVYQHFKIYVRLWYIFLNVVVYSAMLRLISQGCVHFRGLNTFRFGVPQSTPGYSHLSSVLHILPWNRHTHVYARTKDHSSESLPKRLDNRIK
jgi:hypothetical protein